MGYSLKLWLPNPVHSSLRGGVSVLFLESWWACGCLEPCATVEVMLCGFPGFVCVARPLTFSHCRRLRIWQTGMVLFEKIVFIYFVCSCAGVCIYIYMRVHDVCMYDVCLCICVEVRGQLLGAGPLLPQSGSWRSDSHCPPGFATGRHLYLLGHLSLFLKHHQRNVNKISQLNKNISPWSF